MGRVLEIVVSAIEAHRDKHWPDGQEVKDPADAELYDVAIWVRSQQQEVDIEEEQDGTDDAFDFDRAYERDPE